MRRHPLLAPLAVLALLAATLPIAVAAQGRGAMTFTRADTLRGSDGPGRAWWDATFYDLNVRVMPADSSLAGWNAITYRVVAPRDAGQEMQIDLQPPLEMDSVVQNGRALAYRRDGNAFFVEVAEPQRVGDVRTVALHYHGRPRVAVRPPWDGGYAWETDELGNPWVSTSNQGLGASVWWPTKDFMSEEPDSQRIAITVPDPMVDVSNGRLRSTTHNGDGTTTYEWFVASPINNYSVSVNAGSYVHWREEFAGELGTLTLDFWPLAVHEEDARRQWAQVRPMMECFEHWFGPYPWYEDGYKLVEAPYLGMEHQSAVTYGNGFANGYRGTDLSETGQGLLWDFIIIHESAHEWWGNNITAADGADLWIHEGFANYSENLYTECLTGSKDAGAEYVIGTRASPRAGIRNDRPIVGHYGVNDEGSADRYYKGGNLLHTVRQLVDDDARWRNILRGLNEDFRRSNVTTAQVEDYISRGSGMDLSRVFDQYLRTTMVPVFEYRLEGEVLRYRWTNVVEGFDMPVRVTVEPGSFAWLRPTAVWQTVEVGLTAPEQVTVDDDFYVEVRAGG
ncbi:MAG TPA: M1 family metallopeptidase [Longimicrobiales bacterium]|jgi:aminopeptidase N